MPYSDREQQKQAQRDHYKKNKSRYIRLQRERRHKRRKWLDEYKSSKKCETCGESHPAVLDFHHKSKNKEMGIGDAIHQWNIDRIKKEIKKCIILCSNCHRILHWEEKQKREVMSIG